LSTLFLCYRCCVTLATSALAPVSAFQPPLALTASSGKQLLSHYRQRFFLPTTSAANNSILGTTGLSILSSPTITRDPAYSGRCFDCRPSATRRYFHSTIDTWNCNLAFVPKSVTISAIMPRRSSRAASAVANAKITKDSDEPLGMNGDTKGETDETEEKTASKKKTTLKGASSDANGSANSTTTKKKNSPSTPKKRKSKGSSSSDSESESAPKKRKTSPKKKKSTNASSSEPSVAETATSVSSNNENGTKSTSKTAAKSPPKKKAPTHQRWTERTPLPKLHDAKHSALTNGSHTFTILSWNVAGLRALVKNHPDSLPDLVTKYDADVLCLQETKLQEGHLEDTKLKLKENLLDKMMELGYRGYFCYSTVKKGYSGTAMFLKQRVDNVIATSGSNGDAIQEDQNGEDSSKKGKKKQATLGAFFASKKAQDGEDGWASKNGTEDIQSVAGKPTGNVPSSIVHPIKIINELGLPTHDGEGRVITVEYPLFYLTNVYVPNSGQKLDRLTYRTSEWDADFVQKMQQYESEGNKPVIWLGDLNVAYDEKDTWNEGAKHLAKSAGTTPEERASFKKQLEGGFVDAFRHLHPEGRGHYTYWSQRAGNRAPNQGLRLDYFVCSEALMEDGEEKRAIVRDSYMVHDQMGSDHCPIVLEIEIKK